MASIYETIEVPDSNNGVFLPPPPPQVGEDDEVDPSSKGKASSSTIRITQNLNNSKSIIFPLSDFLFLFLLTYYCSWSFCCFEGL